MTIVVRKRASSTWIGSLGTGSGHIRSASGTVDNAYTLQGREADASPGTNPEELIGAGLAGCFAMSLANLLEERNFTGVVVNAKAVVQLEGTETGFSITTIELAVTGAAEGIDSATFTALAAEAKRTCPVSRALAGTRVVLTSSTLSAEPA